MSDRVYVLLDIADGRSEEVVQSLWGKPGVTKVDSLEGSPNIIMVCEATDRHKLTGLTAKALDACEPAIKNITLLPVRSQEADERSGRLSYLKEAIKVT